MHVAVFADIEGSVGIWRMRQCRWGTAEWQYGRHCLTEDVNHVVQGAFEGGADKVTIKDTHETGFNCLIPKLDKRARYIGGHYATPTFFGNIADYDLVLYVAIHAASGTENAFFPHTHYGIFSKVTVNGKPVCEMDLYGAYLGEHGVPVGFVSGEDTAVNQALEALPWAKSVVVSKERDTYTSKENSPDYLRRTRETLKTTAAEAVKQGNDMKPLQLKGPFHIEAVFRKKALADRFNTWDLDQNGAVVSWRADNMIEGFNKLNLLTFFPKKIYKIRRPLLFFSRQVYRFKSSYLAPKANPEDAVLK